MIIIDSYTKAHIKEKEDMYLNIISRCKDSLMIIKRLPSVKPKLTELLIRTIIDKRPKKSL